ncbi:acyltransferase [Neobacillus novalis]|uniref:Acyltransferase n=1 Tax=Neobacillus novalis TaxID=220687 RepID=A0AA95ML32_9BACI|nr:acyltransferase [Neobacillus novalis]WHY85187.1 acyltransferase [Neobacillus novalis]
MNEVSLNTIKNDSKASRILDLIRFLASLVVFLFHFYIPLPGYQVVMIFFVLSGYFISSSVLKAINDNKWSWFNYFLNRLIRLWIVLLPSLILTFLWAKVQFSIFGESKISNYLSWKIFFGNLFFLQGISVPVYGLNGPLWSLSYEFWYYIIFPCLVLIIYSRKKSMKVFYAVIVIIILAFIGLKMNEYFLVWLLGAIIPFVKPMRFKINVINHLTIFLSAILVLISMKAYAVFVNHPNLQILPDLCIGIAFSFFLYFVISFFNNTSGKSKMNIPKYLAAFSYTLYLTHYPLAHFILTWRASKYWTYSGIESYVIKIMVMVVVILYAWLLGLLTEKHTEKVRKLLFGLFKSIPIKRKKSIIINKYL